MAADPMPTETESVQSEALAVVAEAEAMTVANQIEFEAAGSFLTCSIKPAQKRVEEFFGPMKQAAHKAWKTIVARETEVLAPLADAETRIKRAMGAYAAEQERQRRAAEEAAASLAKEEQARMEAERRAKAEALADAGETEAAVELLDAPAPIAFVLPAAAEAPKAIGISVRRSWKFQVVDPAKVNRAFLLVDEKKIAALVRAIGPDAAAQVGGIVVTEEFGISGKAR